MADRTGVTMLIPDVVLRVDPDPVKALRRTLGRDAAASHVAAARGRIGHRAGRLQDLVLARDFVTLVHEVQAIAADAATLGLTDIVRVAQDVTGCMDRRDSAGIGATLARLGRLCDRALDLTGAMRDGGR